MCWIIYGNQQASKSKDNHTHDALRRCCHLQTEDPLSEQLQLLNPPWRKKKQKRMIIRKRARIKDWEMSMVYVYICKKKSPVDVTLHAQCIFKQRERKKKK